MALHPLLGGANAVHYEYHRTNGYDSMNDKQSLPLRLGAVAEPKVAVIVLNWNGWLDTVECLESLLRSDYENFQIIVCDNDSVDGSFQRLLEWADGSLTINTTAEDAPDFWSYQPVPKPINSVVYTLSTDTTEPECRPDTKLIFIQTGSNLGYAGGNNVGIRYAQAHSRASYLWILNNDTVVDSQAMRWMVECASRDHRIGNVGATLLQYGKPDTIQALAGGALLPMIGLDTQFGRGEKLAATSDVLEPLEHVVGASMFVRIEAVRDVGLLDESYFLYREETSWCIKFRKMNWKLSYSPKSIIWHKEGRSTGFKSDLHDYYSVRNMLFLIKEYYPRSLPTTLLYWACIAVLPKLVRMQFHRVSSVGRAFRDFFRGIRGKSDAFTHSWPLLEAALRAEDEAVRRRARYHSRRLS